VTFFGSRGVWRALGWARRRFGYALVSAPRRVMRTSLGSVSYDEDDFASGIPVVLFHDASDSPASMEPLFGALRGMRPIIAVDLPNHGHSERLSRQPSREELARTVIEILADVSARYGASPDVVAAGTSGELCARGLARAPHLARSLAVLASPASPAPLRIFGAWRHVDASAYAALSLPLCFLHGGADGASGDLSPLARALDGVVASRPSTRRVSLGEEADDPCAVADALGAFWGSLVSRPKLRVVRGERRGPRAPAGGGPRLYPRAVSSSTKRGDR
jgi:pimeloyl-ACP methyl ester carboxylesterase